MGLITTNSLRQTFNRRVVQAALGQGTHLLMAIPDHPWVDGAGNADVRIAMTVLAPEAGEGAVLRVTGEQTCDFGEVAVTLQEQRGLVHADLSVGITVSFAQVLQSNLRLSYPGVEPHGKGFVVTAQEAQELLAKGEPTDSFVSSTAVIREYRNGRDLTDKPRGVKVIDAFGMSSQELRQQYPGVYQWLLERVKPERDQNPRASRREQWWIFGEPCSKFRAALPPLKRYIATVNS